MCSFARRSVWIQRPENSRVIFHVAMVSSYVSSGAVQGILLSVNVLTRLVRQTLCILKGNGGATPVLLAENNILAGCGEASTGCQQQQWICRLQLGRGVLWSHCSDVARDAGDKVRPHSIVACADMVQWLLEHGAQLNQL